MKSLKKPVILVTNDDGIHAPGLRKLIEIMIGIGSVLVVAPDKPNSGMAHAITTTVPLRLTKIKDEGDYKEYSCSGTPVDSVKLGERVLLKGKPDLLVSGINHGSNSSINVIYSGTMAAVLEGAIDGIPSIGFSLLDYSIDADFSGTGTYISTIAKNVLRHGLPQGVCLNVNIPAVKEKELRGIKICRQAKGRWNEEFEERTDPRKKDYYWLTGAFENGDTHPDSDAWALANNYVSVVPVHFDLTAHHALQELKKWEMSDAE